MTYEFEGATEQEAIGKAVEELGLAADSFDVEILETQRPGLFKKGSVKIRVHTGGEEAGESRRSPERKEAPPPFERGGEDGDDGGDGEEAAAPVEPEPQNDFERNAVAFVEELIGKMGFPGKAEVLFRKAKKLGINITSPHSSLLIGKKGVTLDALQVIVNCHVFRKGGPPGRTAVVLDIENYRERREESLVQLARTVAERVKETRRSILLEPMQPFDRRLVHRTLHRDPEIVTESEGKGARRQVRVSYLDEGQRRKRRNWEDEAGEGERGA